ncbi:MAG: DEAD/DEAH box helicase, partial [Candidatus Nanopelagicales bacterium]
ISPTIARDVASLAESPGVAIPAEDLAEFQFSYYPLIRDQAGVVSGDGSVELPEISAPKLKLAVTFAPKHLVTLDWAFTYSVGDRDVEFQLTDSALVGRDTKAERDLLEMLDDLGADALWNPLFHGLARRTSVALVGMDTSDFARKALPELIADPRIDVVVSGEPADYSEADAPPLISVTTSDSEDPDWFELNVAVSIDGESVELAPLLLALGSGDEYLLLDSGTSFRLDRPELNSLRDLIEEARGLADTSGNSLRLTRLHVGLWEDLVNLGVVAEQSTRWRDSVRQLLSASALATLDAEVGSEAAPLALPDDFGTELRPYQQAGYEWLCQLWDLRLGGILADDMGLGKTVQTLALASRAAHARQLGANGTPLLIVAPTSVVATWAEQAQRFCPQLRTATINETQNRSGVPLSEAADGADIVVTSYALFRIDAEAYQQIPWSGLVLDEAQFVKNHQSKTYQAARRLKADFKLAITGTPMENSLMDLWSMLSIAAPGLFPNPKRFTQDYLKPIEQGKDPEVLDRLRRRVRPLMLRRTKDQVALDLPPKTEQVLHVPLHSRHRRIYDTHLNRERQRLLGMLDDMNRNRIEILKSLTTLRQLSLDAALLDPAHDQKVPSAKIDVLVEQLQEVAAEGHRALVFSQFTRFLGRVRDRLSAEGIQTCYLDGRTRDRQRRIDEFVNGTAPAFLISLKAGGFGLNLTAADYVYVLDPWWNPAAEAQAVDRTHRIGQERPVMVYRLISTGTIEEKVMALQDRKRELFAAVMDGGTTGAPLTPDDIRALLSP